MANFHLIRDLCKAKNITLKQLCEKTGITENGMQRILNVNKTTTDTLEVIAKELDVPVSVFFDDSTYNTDILLKKYNAENYILSNLVRELRFRLNSGELYIDRLLNNIRFLINNHPDNEAVKSFASIIGSNEYNPFSNIDIKKIINEAQSAVYILSNKEDKESNEPDQTIEERNYAIIAFENKPLSFAELQNKLQEFIKKYPDLKKYENEIAHFVFYEIYEFDQVGANS